MYMKSKSDGNVPFQHKTGDIYSIVAKTYITQCDSSVSHLV